jgi:hypothetical protein
MTTERSIPSEPATAEVVSEVSQPVIVDLGKRKPAKLKELKAGEGELWEEVLDVIDEVKEALGEEASGKMLVPIILMYEKKRARARLNRLLFPLAR